MTKATKRLTNPRVREISLVDDGDNPGAFAMLWKRRGGLPSEGDSMSGADRFRALLETVKKAIGGADPGEAVRKALYEEVREESMKEGVNHVLMGRLNDLSQALYGTLFFGTEESADMEGALKTSVQQFAAEVQTDIPDILAGRIVKAIASRYEGEEVPPDPDTFAAGVGEEIQKLAAEDNSPTGVEPHDTEGTGMSKPDLSKLSETDRATVEKALALTDRTGELETENTALKAAAVEKKVPEKTPETDPDEILKSLPENVRSILEKRDAKLLGENDDLRKRVVVMEQKDARGEFAKAVAFTHVPSAPDLVDLLVDVETEKRGKIVDIFKACDELIRKGRATLPVGSDIGGDTSAEAAIDGRAAELRKLHPDMTIEKARATVTEQDPDLYRQYLEEAGQVPTLPN